MAIQFTVPKVNKKIIAVDFDGTIIKNRYPLIENPDNDMIDFIKRNRKKYIWILWTCRTGEKLEEAVNYLLVEHGLRFDYINENAKENLLEWGTDTRKIYADYYIDDHNRDIYTLMAEGAR